MSWLGKAKIVEHQALTPWMYFMKVEAPELAQKSFPGQFCMLRVSKSLDPLLRRPISIHQIHKNSGTVAFLYYVVGKGTELLAQYGIGEEVDIQGPLGNGFFIKDINQKNVVVVGGGLGIAPMLPLLEDLMSNNIVTFLAGGRNSEGLTMLSYYPEIQIKTATDDGSEGIRGTALDLLKEKIKEEPAIDMVFACGPWPMLKAIVEVCDNHGIPCQVSLEEKMACGVGACLGCACKGNREQYLKVCKEGPVFWSQELGLLKNGD